MFKLYKTTTVGIIYAIANLLIFSSLKSQTLWLHQSMSKGISIEILRPDFKNGEDIGFITSTSFFTARFPISQTITVVGEIPFAVADFKNDQSSTEASLGNPYVGIELHERGAMYTTELGVRYPLIEPDFSSIEIFLSYITDFIDRAEAFLPEIIPFSGAIRYHNSAAFPLVINSRVATVVWVPKGDNGDNELWLLYSMQMGYKIAGTSITAGISGRWWASGEDGDFNDNSMHQAGLTATSRWGSFKPSLTFKLPLDQDLKDMIGYVLGINLSYFI